jgi:hypothetical protein
MADRLGIAVDAAGGQGGHIRTEGYRVVQLTGTLAILVGMAGEHPSHYPSPTQCKQHPAVPSWREVVVIAANRWPRRRNLPEARWS